MKSKHLLAKEKAELSFEQNEYLEIYNTKNRHTGKWIRPVNLEIVNTLLSTDKFKVTYVDRDGELYTNFEV